MAAEEISHSTPVAAAFKDARKPGPRDAEVQVRAAGPDGMRSRLKREWTIASAEVNELSTRSG